MALPIGLEIPLPAIYPSHRFTMLKADRITKKYNGKIILNDVSLSVQPGQITALIGPSGSGKTTLLKSLALLDYPNYGTISLDDATYNFPLVKRQEIKPPWPHVTIVFQQHFLWPHLTLRQNIMLPLIRKGTFVRKQAESLIESLGLTEFCDRYPNEASLGQRQRTALARALVLEPSYILLDEVTSSLDVEQVSVILSHLQLLRERNIGILIITHLIGFASRAADQIVFLDQGEVLETGGVELLRSPKHERVRKFLSVIESAM
jgi:cystine transport system ATP-binding protein